MAITYIYAITAVMAIFQHWLLWHIYVMAFLLFYIPSSVYILLLLSIQEPRLIFQSFGLSTFILLPFLALIER